MRDKLFFFSNTEWNRIRSAGSKVYEIPSASFLATAAPATQAYFQSFGTVAASTRLGATIPVSGYTGANPLQLATVNAPFDAGAGSPENQWSTLNRFDYTLNQKLSMYFRAGDFKDAFHPWLQLAEPICGVQHWTDRL